MVAPAWASPKEVRPMKTILREMKNASLIILGALSAGMGLKGFLLSSHFIDGGVTGISMLLNNVLGYPLSILIVLINLPFIAVGYRQIGRAFAIRSTAAIALLSGCLAVIHYPDVTPDKLLTALFGGFFLGVGIGLAIRGGAVLDGTEIAALLMSKTNGVLRVGNVILLMNVAIFSAAAWYLGIESALYSMLTYLAASKTVDFLIYGIEAYHGVMIVSPRHEDIKGAILENMKRGITVYKGRGGYTEAEQDILYCVATRLEIPKIRNIVQEIDENAFIVVHHIEDVTGGVVKRRVPH